MDRRGVVEYVERYSEGQNYGHWEALLWKNLDSIQDQVVLDSILEWLIVGAAVAVTTLSAGYVLWVLRGGYLVASLLSSLPTWQFVDPLPALDHAAMNNASIPDDRASLSALIDRANRQLSQSNHPAGLHPVHGESK